MRQDDPEDSGNQLHASDCERGDALEDDLTLQLIPIALMSKLKSVIESIFKHEPVSMQENEK